MINIMIAGLFLADQGGSAPDIKAADFRSLVAGQYADLRDLVLVYEGERRYVGPTGRIKGDLVQFTQSYQGTYAWRSDGAMLIDFLLKGHEADGSGSPLVRQTMSYLNHKTEKAQRIPDLKQTAFEAFPRDGRVTFYDVGSYARVLFSWYLAGLDDPSASGYEFIGWEEVDGRHCLVVQFNLLARAVPENNPVRRFWIDLERGAHALRYETRRGSSVEERVAEVVLSTFLTPDGRTVWLPVRGEYKAFGNRSNVSATPKFLETYALVGGSVQLNQGLRDEMFSAKWKGDLAGTDEMKALRRLTLAIPKKERGRTDPEGVKANLDRLVAEADRQSTMLEASSSAREVWNWAPILQGLFVAAGVALLAGVIAYKRKAG